MEIQVTPQTLLIMVGPSNCGKTYISNKIKEKIHNFYPNANIQHISSDQIRHELLGHTEFKKDNPYMYESSEAAFEVFYNKVEAAMKFPIDAQYIIADATNLHEDSLTRLCDIAHKHFYKIQMIVFHYNKLDMYFEYMDDNTMKNVTRLHYKRLNNMQSTIHRICKKYSIERTILRKPPNNIQVVFTMQWKTYFDKYLHYDYANILIIGDVHGNIKALGDMLQQHDIIIHDDKTISINSDKELLVVFVGDYIDKNTEENERYMIDLLYQNIDHPKLLFIRGNHERFVVNYLGKNPAFLQTSSNVVNNYFTSIKWLQSDKEYREKLFMIYSKLLSFVKWPNVVVTHAPVHKQFATKINCRKMYTGGFMFNDSIDTKVDKLLSMMEADRSFEPLLVSGHLSTVFPFRYKNRVFVDCTNAGKIGAVLIDSHKNTKFYEVEYGKAKENVPNLLIHFKQKTHQQQKIKFDDLDRYDIKRLRYIKKHKIQFLSGTMPPANATKDSIEDINTVFKYYKRMHIDKLICEPKFMGSRINVYIHYDDKQDIISCKFITRSGFLAHISDEVKAQLTNECKIYYNKIKESIGYTPKFVLLDGELLPWKLLGESLINEQFWSYYELNKNELEVLASTGFDKLMDEKRELLTTLSKLDKKELIDKYGHHTHRLISALKQSNFISVEAQQKGLDIFKRQLDLYTNDDTPHIEVFMILKIDNIPFYEFEHNSNLNHLTTHSSHFRLLNKHDALVIDITNEADINKAIQFFNHLSFDEGYEGIVVKPNEFSVSILSNIIPYFKVRNEDYLHIIYGHLYKLSNLTIKRTLRQKMEAALQEWNAALKLLKVFDKEKYDKELADIYLEFKYGEKLELQTDPRL